MRLISKKNMLLDIKFPLEAKEKYFPLEHLDNK